MPRPDWARLSAPFPPSARAWALQALSPDRQRALVAPRLSAASVRARLDDTVGPEGWSCQLLPLGESALVCNLTVEGVTRSAVAELPRGAQAGSELASAASLGETALYLCAAQFGMAAAGEAGWAPYDPETGEVLVDELYEGEELDEEREEEEPVAAELSAPEEVAQPAPVEERPEAHLVIDRLVERLRSEGLGAAAARLVVRYDGYGRTPEETRELYGKLRALLVTKAAVGS
jgi:hypothetical protein